LLDIPDDGVESAVSWMPDVSRASYRTFSFSQDLEDFSSAFQMFSMLEAVQYRVIFSSFQCKKMPVLTLWVHNRLSRTSPIFFDVSF
jgi:hypothetical protein